MKELKLLVNDHENYTKRKNIRIEGIPEFKNENQEQTQKKVEQLFKVSMELPNIEIENINRISNNFRVNNQQPRTVLVKLANSSCRNQIMKNSHRLKGTGIYLNEDLSDLTMRARKEQMPQLRQARQAGKIAYFRNYKLIVKEKTNATINGLQPQINPANSFTPPRGVPTLINIFSPQTPPMHDNTNSSNTAVTGDRVLRQRSKS